MNAQGAKENIFIAIFTTKADFPSSTRIQNRPEDQRDQILNNNLRSNAKMSLKKETKDGRISGDIELINLDEVNDDELTRKKLRDWARQYSKGEFHPSKTTSESSITKSTSIKSIAIKSSNKNAAQEPKSQTSTSKSYNGEKYQFPDWSQHIAQAPETKKPIRRSSHARRPSSNEDNFFPDPRQAVTTRATIQTSRRCRPFPRSIVRSGNGRR